MLRPRVTAAQRKELLDRRSGNHHKRLGGVMVVPGIKSIADWEAEATISQERLIAEARDDPRHVVTEPASVMTAAQERSFEAHVSASRRQQEPITEEQRAAKAYAKALGIYR